MNKNELITAVAEASGVSKKDTAAVLDTLLDKITAAVAEGDKVQLIGFGTFESREHGERTSRHPRTKPKLKYVVKAEQDYDFGPLLDKAVAETTWKMIP